MACVTLHRAISKLIFRISDVELNACHAERKEEPEADVSCGSTLYD